MRHLKIYRAIRLIQRTGSIRKAAENLAISPSALNRSVQSFEEELGLPVFDRVPGGVRLTMAGELLLNLLDRHLVAFDDLRAQLGHLREGVSGTLDICLGSDIGAGLVLQALRAFEDAFPGVSVTLVTDDTALPLHRREADLAILTNPETDDGVEVVHGQRLRIMAWAGAAQPAPLGLWDLAGRRVLLPPEGAGARIAISHVLRRKRLQLGAVSSLSAAQMAQILPEGSGVAIFPETVFDAPDLPQGLHKLALPLGEVQLCVLRAAKVPMIRPAQAFLAVLQRHLDAATNP